MFNVAVSSINRPFTSIRFYHVNRSRGTRGLSKFSKNVQGTYALGNSTQLFSPQGTRSLIPYLFV